MRLVAPTKILMADRQGDYSYLLAFATLDASYEVYLPGAGWAGEFAGFMTPSIRNQATGEGSELSCSEAEELAAKLATCLSVGNIAKGVEVSASECLDALSQGKRYGCEA